MCLLFELAHMIIIHLEKCFWPPGECAVMFPVLRFTLKFCTPMWCAAFHLLLLCDFPFCFLAALTSLLSIHTYSTFFPPSSVFNVCPPISSVPLISLHVCVLYAPSCLWQFVLCSPSVPCVAHSWSSTV